LIFQGTPPPPSVNVFSKPDFQHYLKKHVFLGTLRTLTFLFEENETGRNQKSGYPKVPLVFVKKISAQTNLPPRINGGNEASPF